MSLCEATPIVKPYDDRCNLSCVYCYVREGASVPKRTRMSQETLIAMTDFFCEKQEDIEFIWHGGEPLLAGIDFYGSVVRAQSKWVNAGRNITNFVQTNAVLVDREWAEFFSRNGFVVGVSLDGTARFHNVTRPFSGGGPSFDNVMRGITLLRSAGVFNGVICGVTRYNHAYPEELFNFFISEGIKKLKFSRIKDIGNRINLGGLVLSPEEFYNFLIKIFDLWIDLDDPEVEIRDIQSVVNVLLGGRCRECIYLGGCDRFVTVYGDGSVYACDSFPQNNNLYFGNIRDISPTAPDPPNLLRFHDTIMRRRERCSSCEWGYLCRGGCAKDNYSDLTSREPLPEVCAALRMYFGHIFARLKFFGLV